MHRESGIAVEKGCEGDGAVQWMILAVLLLLLLLLLAWQHGEFRDTQPCAHGAEYNTAADATLETEG
jgi:hypothetical protein